MLCLSGFELYSRWVPLRRNNYFIRMSTFWKMGSKMMPWTLENFTWDKTKLENSWDRIMLVDLNNHG